jgi:NADPH:quinone reductase-like Zn-dependent oxidoreductase
MKAIVYRKYGPPEVLQPEEIPKPIPVDDEVLVKVFATTVTSGDWHLRKADPFLVRLFNGFFKPRKWTILGSEFSGAIEAIGANVKRFKVGDRVFGSTGMALGSYAEYICLPQDGILEKTPSNLDRNEAAAVFFGGNTALHFFRKAKIKEGQEVLVYGASGSVGTAAVQLAKYYGTRVTAVCSTANVDLVRSLGADAVVDYTKNDFSKSGKTYDIVFDTVGKSPFMGSVRSLRNNGYYLRAVHTDLVPVLLGLWISLTSKKSVIGGIAVERSDDLVLLKELIEAGKYRPVIYKRYPMEQMADAHRHAEQGHKRGNVVITLGTNDPS